MQNAKRYIHIIIIVTAATDPHSKTFPKLLKHVISVKLDCCCNVLQYFKKCSKSMIISFEMLYGNVVNKSVISL